jgi:hypothetical protein
MSEACAVEIAFVIDEDLGLLDPSAKRGGMNNSVAVALKFAAIRWGLLRVAAAFRVGRGDGVRGEV